MQKLPIGISDFKEIIETKTFYIDKTLLIKELDEESGKILLLPRPRRFGKTLNMSMLQYFYEKTEQNHAYLFQNLAISNEPELMALQGQYPVIFISLKDVKGDTWNKMYQKFMHIIGMEFMRLKYLMQMPSLLKHEQEQFLRIADGTGSETEYELSLKILIKHVHDYHQKKVIVLIDEYDAPIHDAFNRSFYNPAVSFLRNLMESSLKDNELIEFSVITGILRTAKEGIFSGLNNLRICSILNKSFSDKFGFTQSEVDILLENQKLTHLKDEIKDWYDGYMFGTTHMYNPWSLLMCASGRGELASHWGNTSNNNLIEKIIATATTDVSDDLNTLLDGSSINEKISEGMIFPGMEKKSSAIWNLLLFTGYLTTKSITGNTAEDKIYELVIPNKDVAFAYQERILSIMEHAGSSLGMNDFLHALFTGNCDMIQELLEDFILSVASAYDFTVQDIERSYHLFILGLLVSFKKLYHISSNREAGTGRYDVMIVPKRGVSVPTAADVGVLIEFKAVKKITKNFDAVMVNAAQLALNQIKERAYAKELVSQGFKRVIAYGIACSGKKVIATTQWVVEE